MLVHSASGGEGRGGGGGRGEGGGKGGSTNRAKKRPVEDEAEMKEKRDWCGHLPRISMGSEGEDEVARCSRCGQPLDDSHKVMSSSSMASAARERRPDRAMETKGSNAVAAEGRLVVRLPGGSGPIP
ncbi:hypothetical protein GW17_00021363 [Ensete ventricosum]|nr:hypothetical protein GW17_00021363 [Ensete ventricosum]